MDSPYSLQYLFENDDRYILQIKAKDIIKENGWLLYHKSTHSFVPLTFKCMDSSNFVEERFFDEGFFKVNRENATFIEKFSSKIDILKNLTTDAFPKALIKELNAFISVNHTQISF